MSTSAPTVAVLASWTVAKYDPSAPAVTLATGTPFTPTATTVPDGGGGETLPPTVTWVSVVTSLPPELSVIEKGPAAWTVAGAVASATSGADAVSVYPSSFVRRFTDGHAPVGFPLRLPPGSPGPLTTTSVAFSLVHVSVAVVASLFDAESDAVILGGTFQVTAFDSATVHVIRQTLPARTSPNGHVPSGRGWIAFSWPSAPSIAVPAAVTATVLVAPSATFLLLAPGMTRPPDHVDFPSWPVLRVSATEPATPPPLIVA